jgi:hypothetical protein
MNALIFIDVFAKTNLARLGVNKGKFNLVMNCVVVNFSATPKCKFFVGCNVKCELQLKIDVSEMSIV